MVYFPINVIFIIFLRNVRGLRFRVLGALGLWVFVLEVFIVETPQDKHDMAKLVIEGNTWCCFFSCSTICSYVKRNQSS